jgi:hypothetical protein
MEDVLRPDAFGGKPSWSHLPLVFMNGCGTAGFDHDNAAKFIETFILSKRAAAVIGTETTIAERLAVEAAETFLQDLLPATPPATHCCDCAACCLRRTIPSACCTRCTAARV